MKSMDTPTAAREASYDHGGGANKKALAVVLAFTTTYMFAEVIGGFITGSLALLADAAHMLNFWTESSTLTTPPSRWTIQATTRQITSACVSADGVETSMPRKYTKLVSRMTPIFLAVWAAWLLRRVERDYEEQERLSPEASAAVWALYLLHAWLTLDAGRNPAMRLPGKALAISLGLASMLSGTALSAWGVREFRSFEQMSGLEAGRLVKSGPYRISRNPQVVGWGVALLGISLASRSPGALLLTVFYFLVHRLHAPVEERHLERIFGEEYRRYQTKTPRFLGFPRAE